MANDQSPANYDEKVVHANAEKNFFINMLTRDITLTDAVLDLVDNSVDAARKLRGPDGDYNDLEIRISASENEFKMTDNCGGLDVNAARNSAFKFGRSVGTQSVPHTIGQFGIGMKRALFKMGKQIDISSVAKHDRFAISIDVNEWEKTDLWEFRFNELEEQIKPAIPSKERGVTITVTQLLPEVAKEFIDQSFHVRLNEAIRGKQSEASKKGLVFVLNHSAIEFESTKIFFSDEVKPGYRKKIFADVGKDSVHVELWAGVSVPDGGKAGWYIYCNGRCILEANQQRITGWDYEDGVEIPKFHNQYRWFRGYAFFDCDDSSRLPWNTTKTSVDEDSVIYKEVRRTMMDMTRPVIDFINQIKEQAQADGTTMQAVFPNAPDVPLSEAKTGAVSKFEYKKRTKNVKAKPDTVAVSFRKPVDEVEFMKEFLGVERAGDAGKLVWEYFMEKVILK